MSDEATEPAPRSAGEAGTSATVPPLLIEPDQGWIVDDEATLVASEAGGETGLLSPEESAISVISEDEAPGLSWDESPGYVDESTVQAGAQGPSGPSERGAQGPSGPSERGAQGR